MRSRAGSCGDASLKLSRGPPGDTACIRRTEFGAGIAGATTTHHGHPHRYLAAARPRSHSRDSSATANQRIDRATRDTLLTLYSPDKIRARLAELDSEWNVDRAVTLNFAIVGAATAFMAMRSLKKTGRLGGWGALFWTQMAFLANHTVRGWFPPMPVFRRLKFRSADEICQERVALENRLAQLEG